MSGFKNQLLNEIVKNNIFDYMVDFIFISLEQMKKDFVSKNIKIDNDEEKIRTCLLENYLNNQEFKSNKNFLDLSLLFNPEVPEGYNKKTEEYLGRVDIKVYSINTITNPKDYYIIECKRLDGSSRLNKNFVVEGICRFVSKNKKYSSFNNKNIMLGFVVRNMNIEDNVNKIDKIQNEKDNVQIIKNIRKIEKGKEDYYLYINRYKTNDEKIDLYHMFYNLADIVTI